MADDELELLPTPDAWAVLDDADRDMSRALLGRRLYASESESELERALRRAREAGAHAAGADGAPYTGEPARFDVWSADAWLGVQRKPDL